MDFLFYGSLNLSHLNVSRFKMRILTENILCGYCELHHSVNAKCLEKFRHKATMKPTSINNGSECFDEQPEIKDLYILPYESRMEEPVHLLIKTKMYFVCVFVTLKR